MDNSSKLDDARALQQFTQNVDEMEKWLKEKLLQISSDESFKDPTNIQVSIQSCLNLILSNKLLSAKLLVCFNFKKASISFKVGENV